MTSPVMNEDGELCSAVFPEVRVKLPVLISAQSFSWLPTSVRCLTTTLKRRGTGSLCKERERGTSCATLVRGSHSLRVGAIASEAISNTKALKMPSSSPYPDRGRKGKGGQCVER